MPVGTGMAIRILVNHAHVFPSSINAGGTVERLLHLLDTCGIEQAVCFAPFPHQLRAAGLDPTLWLSKEISRRDRLHGFGTLDLHRSDIRQQVIRIKELGMRGIKMHPNAQEFDILSPAALEAYGAAQDQKLFITFHSGVHHYRLKDYEVLKFDEVSYNFPDLAFSMEHVGGYHFFFEALAVIANRIPFPPVPGKRCMVYAGLTSIFTPNYNRFWYMSRDRLLELLAQAGPEQLIFGLDFPYNLEENTRLALETIRSLPMNEAQCAMVLGGNLRRVLSLPPVPPTERDPLPPVAPD